MHTDSHCLLPAAEAKAKELAQEFVVSLMAAESEMVPDGDGMNVLKGVKDIRGGPAVNIILRWTTEPFWEACKLLADKGHRVCAIGSPGIGKSTTTPVLIKLLLGKGITVVYLKRTTNSTGFYYQFTPNVATGATDVMLFSEDTKDAHVEALTQEATFFIIDPDETDTTCNPSPFVKARVIINASPDNRHWGKNEFAKARDGYTGGQFLYFPLWSLAELLAAAPLIDADVDAETVRTRYRLVGGVPRFVFAPSVEPAVKQLRTAVGKLSATQALSIATGKVAELETSDDTQPQSAIMGYSASADYTKGNAVIISDLARELVVTTHANQLWGVMLAETKSSPRGYLFESYVRNLMLQSGKYESRGAVGKKKKGEEPPVTQLSSELGGCTGIRLVLDVLAALREGEYGVVYHSCDNAFPLLDFAYKKMEDGVCVFTLVNATVGKSHDAALEKITRACNSLVGDTEIVHRVCLVYAVPMGIFQDFMTNPVEPSTRGCPVIVVGIPRPCEEAGGTKSD
jgi:hypothetical protein